MLYEDLETERYTDIPVFGNDTAVGFNDPTFPYDRCIRFIEMPRPSLGDIWDVSCEVHATNDDLRARGNGLYLTTEVLIGPGNGNSRFYTINNVPQPLPIVIRANGSYNIGPEAHHGLIARRSLYKWTQERLDYIAAYPAIYLKFMIWSGSTQAQSGDRCVITPGRGLLECLVHKAPI